MSFFDRDIQVHRVVLEGRWNNGRYIQGEVPTDLTIQGCVQATKGKDLEMLPEARRTRQTYTIYSSTPLWIADSTLNRLSDIVVIDGNKFEVTCVETYQNNVISHYKMIVTKVDQ